MGSGNVRRALLRRHRGFGQKLIAIIGTFVLTTSIVIAVPFTAGVARADAASDAITDGLGQLSDALTGLDGLDELADLIPFTDILPTGGDGLDLVDALTELLETSLAGVTSASQVESTLNGLDGDTIAGGITVNVTVDVTETGSPHTVTFTDLRLSRTGHTSALLVDTEDVALNGLTLMTDFELVAASSTNPLILTIAEGVPPTVGIDVAAAPALSLSVNASADLNPGLSATLGIGQVALTGGNTTPNDPDVEVSASFSAAWLDPDSNGTITGTELTTTAPLDLFDVTWAPSTASMNLEVTSSLIPGVTGTVTLNDTDLSDGLDVPNVQLGDVGDLANLSPQDAILALAQLAVSLDAVQLQLANPDIPLVDQGFAQLVAINEKLEGFFAAQGLTVPGGGPYDFDFTLEDLKTAGLDTIEGLIAELEDELEAAGSTLDLGLGYTNGALTFTINESYGSGDTTDPTLSLDLGNQFSSVGVIGLDAASASLSVDPTFAINLTVGIDISESPIVYSGETPTGVIPITDRVFLDTSTVNEITANAPVTATLDLRGHIGLLELSLGSCDDPSGATCDSTADAIPLLRAASAGNMLEIDLDGGTDARITLTELFDALSAPAGVAVDTVASPPTATITSGGNTLTARINAEVPLSALNASALVGSTPIAGGLVTFELPELLDPSGFSVSASSFDAFSAFNTDDPEAFFALIVNALNDLLSEVDDLSGDGLDFEIPIVDVNFAELTDFLGDMGTEIQALVATPAGDFGALEALLELKVFEVLQSVELVDPSIVLPEIPDPEDYANLAAYETALTDFLETELPAFLAANADFLGLDYDPGGGGTAPALLLTLSFDETKTESKKFNLNLADLGVTGLSSVIGAGTTGNVDLTYGIDAELTVGLELDGLNSPPQPFLLDSSGVKVYADGGLSGGSIEATIGPFGVRIGEATSAPESACDNDADDDGDGFINDGCPQVGDEMESGDQCLNDTDDDSDATTDDINDGCPYEFGATAGFRASFDASNDLDGDDTTVERVYFSGITTWASGIVDRFDFTNPSADGLGGGPDGTTKCGSLDPNEPAVCASLPFFLDAGGTTIFLDEVTIELEGLDPADWTLPDFTDLIQAIEDNATDLALILIIEGVGSFVEFLETSLDGASYDIEIPVLGDALDAGADIVGAFDTGVYTPIETAITDVLALPGTIDSDDIDDALTDALEDALDTDLGLLLNAGDDLVEITCVAPATAPCSLAEIDEVNVRIEVGQASGAFSTQEAFDFGVPGLRFDLGGASLSAEGEWHVNAGFGLSRTEGFYILTDDTDVGVGADVNLVFGPDPIVGDIAFIQLLVTDGKDDPDDPEASIDLVLDVTGGGGKLLLTELLSGPDPLSFNPVIAPEVDLDLDLETQFDVGDEATNNSIPKLLATFQVTWDPDNVLNDLELGAFSAAFNEVQLDLGSFIAEFLAPALEDINRYLDPIRPVIDTISAPVPGVAQLAELVGEEPPTLLDLFEGVSGNDLTFIRRIIQLIDFIGAVGDVAASVTPDGSCSLCIPIGDFSLSGGQLFSPALPASQRSQLIGTQNLTTTNVLDAIDNRPAGDFGGNGAAFKSAFSSSRTGGGFEFPAFEHPEQLFQLLVGANPTLVEWRSGLLKASFGFSQSFGPIFVGPIPISIVISGSAGVEGQFGIGYDTKGIRQLVEILTDDDAANDSFFGGVSALLAGVFIDDLDANGNDVPEIAFFAEIAAGAALDAVIVSAGVEGGVRAEITLNLHDGGYASPPPPENLDGKLRIDEIVSFVNNPLCIFDVGGKLTAFLRAFVEIDLFLVSKKFSFTIVNITLLEFENLFADACEPAEPEPATPVGDNDEILRLNMGPFAGDRNFASNETEERFVLRQLDVDSVSVTAFGITKEYHGITRVFGNGGTDDDVVILETGVNLENSDTETQPDGEPAIDNGPEQQVDFTIPAVLCGGSGDDRILGGYGDDRIYGDGDDSGIDPTSMSCPDADETNDGNDILTGNGGADRVFGQGANDIVTGDAGDDPELRGGPGEDEVVGGAGRDTLYGDGDNDTLLGGPEAPPSGDEADDTINGGDGDDTIEGDWGDDTLNGDDGDDTIIGNQGEDVISGGDDNDRILGNEDDDDIAGNDGDDEIQGNDGDDDIYGDDRVGTAGTGRDDIVGGAGADDIWGGPGEDVILGDEGEIFRDQLAIAADPEAGAFDPPDDTTPLFMLTAGDPFGDTLNGDDDADLIYGQEGDDTINGNGGDDELHGNAGIDTMSGNAGGDTMFGDAGDDQMYGDSATPSAANDGADTMRGGNDNDTMRGNADGDSIFGDSGDDTIYGDAEAPDGANDGVDTIRGGPDHDLIYGNADGDFLFGDGGADRMIGGSADADESDGADTMSGGYNADVMIGDNGTIGIGDANAPDDIVQKLITLRVDGDGAGDTMAGDDHGDRMFGQAGGDTMTGNDGSDYMEGNAGSDDMEGNAGSDDMIGGSSAAPDGAGDAVIDADRVGTGAADDGDEMWGGTGIDWMAGDNARIERNFHHGSTDDLVLFDVNSASSSVSGGDYMYGGSSNDVMFGQGNGGQPATEADPPDGFDNDLDGGTDEDGPFDMSAGNPWHGDALFGEGGLDYIEGNHGSDYIDGGANDDDLIGGGSANDGTTGVIDADRNGTGLDDARDTIHGDDGVDWIAGDNARLTRVFDRGSTDPIVLFDVNSTITTVSAGDYLRGGDDDDVMFGQGNGDQPPGQADPIDGINNDLDGNTDEDQPWHGDVMFGDAGDDYMEGNHGADLMFGDTGDGSATGHDDMVGGGSANDGAGTFTGTFDSTRTGTGLDDAGDVMFGEGGIDWMAGDNAFVERNEHLGGTNDFVLFDVNSSDQDVSGGDYMNGGSDDDLMVGQGNGAQTGQADPLDGVDTDADGTDDEDQPWLGDVMLGGIGDDYMEGNHGADVMWGDDGDADASDGDGEDDMIGGGSALNGVLVLDGAVIDTGRDGNGLNDEGDVMRGEGAEDYMSGDNARIDRTGDSTGLTLATDRSVQLFDVENVGETADVTAYSGGDWMSGGDHADVMFGQGNGAQGDQADPLDGVDNDFDGREDGDPTDPDDQGWDCADNGFDNDDDGFADGDDPQCQAAVDEDQPWAGDVMYGNAGDDYMEGNHGADWMFGGAEEDDMVGGGSADDGAVVPNRDGTGLKDGRDVMHGEGDDDVMAGDNAWINRTRDNGTWARLDVDDAGGQVAGFADYDQTVRVTGMFAGDAGADAHGNDYMTGGIGQDEMYGQLEDDFVLGNEGDDVLIGDLGQVRANLLGDDASDPDPQVIETASPRWEDTIYEVGSMLWETELYAYDTSNGGVGGNDILLGYDGRDTAFGGPGDDTMNGDGDGTVEYLDETNPEYSHIEDVVEGTADEDMLFGGDGDDAIWGGRHNDIMYGGHGEDNLDVRPREETDNGRHGANFRIIPRDPPLWFAFAYPENLQDVDFMYGGWDADAHQADQAENGPDPGDKMADWAGGYNVFYLCPAGYGDFTITRSGSPFVRRYIQDLAEASGAYMSASNGESGFRDVGFVFPNERGQNSHPPHPDHPGHFTCIDYTGIGNGLAEANAGGPYIVPEGGAVSLDGTGSTGEGALSYAWFADTLTFDDPSAATPGAGAGAVDDGVEQVLLEVTDAEGGFDLMWFDVTVENVAPSTADDPSGTAVLGQGFQLSMSFVDPGMLDTHTAVIDWGDGGTCDTTEDGAACSVDAAGGAGTVTASHSYAAIGSYEVTVTVTDDDGGVVVATGAVDVVVGAQTAAAWAGDDAWPVDPVDVAAVDYSRADALAVFDQSSESERSSTLFMEVVAALLNAGAGAETSCVSETLTAAEAWLVQHPPGSGVADNSNPWKKDAVDLWTVLVDYNTGVLCAPPG